MFRVCDFENLVVVAQRRADSLVGKISMMYGIIAGKKQIDPSRTTNLYIVRKVVSMSCDYFKSPNLARRSQNCISDTTTQPASHIIVSTIEKVPDIPS